MSTKGYILTKKQTALLKFLYQFRMEYGESPTLSMVVAAQGLSSNRSVIDMLHILVDRGYLQPSSKISHATVLTAKALKELGLLGLNDITGVPQAPVVRHSYINGSQTIMPTNPPRWLDASQPKGTEHYPGSDDLTRLLRSAVSSLLRASEGTSNFSDKSAPRLHPLTFFAVSCTAIYLIFGKGIEAGLVFVIVATLIIKRSVK